MVSSGRRCLLSFLFCEEQYIISSRSILVENAQELVSGEDSKFRLVEKHFIYKKNKNFTSCTEVLVDYFVDYISYILLK